jgi:SpoVK/Ycf46/Vps4 family AAA+-type ATPase
MSKFRKATREQAKLRAALVGPPGSGKTFTSLALACALAAEARKVGAPGRVALIDTEVGSSELYANRFEFDVMHLTSHSPLVYVEALADAAAEGYDHVVIDSLSHAWMGKDGALEQVDKAAERDPRGNSFTAWRNVTPKHTKLVDAILSCPMHLIATIRAKTEYVQEKNAQGKTEIRKLGMQAIQRDGLEFEFSLVADMDQSNTLKVSKTRLEGVIAPGDVFERPGEALAKKIYSWLTSGAAPTRPPAPVAAPAVVVEPVREQQPANDALANAIDAAFVGYLAAIDNAQTLPDLDRAASSGEGKPAKGTANAATAGQHYHARKAWIEQQAKAGAA